MGISIDPELQALIPALKPDERQQLESSLQTEGCRDALVVWKKGDRYILVDGHNRYAICQQYNIPFTSVEREFESKEDVKLWMYRNQLARRNLPDSVRITLVLDMEDVERAKAKQRQSAAMHEMHQKLGHSHNEEKLPANSPEASKGETRQKLAEAANVGQKRIDQGRRIKNDAPDFLKQWWHDEQVSTNRAYDLTKALDKANADILEAVEKHVVTEPETVNILKRLYRNKSDTFEEILDSGYIQPGDEEEAVAITDTPLRVQTALDTKAKFHRQQAKEAKREEAAKQGQNAETDRITFIHADFAKHEIEAGSIDLIFTDPPYDEQSLHLWSSLAEKASVWLKDGGALVAYSGQRFLPMVYSRVGQHLDYYWTCAVQHLSGEHRMWMIKGWVNWKPVIIWHKGQRPDNDWFNDHVALKPSADKKDFHDWSQPLEEAKYFIDKFSIRGDTILDPMCGAGTIPTAAALLGRKAIGIEIDEQSFHIAKGRAMQHLGEDHDRDKISA